jgi:hypothetical protein
MGEGEKAKELIRSSPGVPQSQFRKLLAEPPVTLVLDKINCGLHNQKPGPGQRAGLRLAVLYDVSTWPPGLGLVGSGRRPVRSSPPVQGYTQPFAPNGSCQDRRRDKADSATRDNQPIDALLFCSRMRGVVEMAKILLTCRGRIPAVTTVLRDILILQALQILR